jgi:fluoride exporter
MFQLLLIALGGAVGTAARYGVSIWARDALGTGFPYGTLAVNVLGSFLLGFIMQIGLRTEVLTSSMRLTLGTGVMGGFTTYSTFNYESLRYFDERAWAVGFLNVGVTLFGCFVAGTLGILAGRRLGGA